MADPSEVDVSDEAPPPAPRGTRWALWIGLVCLAPLLAAGVVTAYRLRAEQQRNSGILSTTLPDGSRIIVDQVSIGRVHTHVLREGNAVRVPLLGRFGQDPLKTTLTSGADRIVIFFRHVRPDGSPGDLGWWRAWQAMTDDEDTLEEEEGSRIYQTQGNGVSSCHGTLGFDTPPNRLEKVVGAVELPISAFGGPSIPLQLLDEKREVVASLDVPVSVPMSTPAWSPEEFPVHRRFGDLEVILKGVQVQAHTYNSRNRDHVYYTMKRDWEILQNGEPARGWRIDNEVIQDEAGETGLPPKSAWKSPVWKLTALLSPVPPAGAGAGPDAVSEQAALFRNAKTIADIPSPAPNTNQSVDKTVMLGMSGGSPFPIVVDRVGAGNSEWSGTGARPHGHGGGHGTSDEIGEFHVSSNHSSTDWSVRVRTAGMWIRLVHNRLQTTERLEFAAVDDQGRPLKVVKHRGGPDLTWLHVGPLADTKSVALTVFPLRTFPIMVDFAPPPRPKPTPAPAKP